MAAVALAPSSCSGLGRSSVPSSSSSSPAVLGTVFSVGMVSALAAGVAAVAAEAPPEPRATAAAAAASSTRNRGRRTEGPRPRRADEDEERGISFTF